MTDESPVTLESLSSEGRALLNEHEAVRADSDFGYWDSRVASWLDERFPNTGLSARWSATSSSAMVIGNQYYDDPNSWMAFKVAVQKRLAFLGELATAIHSPKRQSSDSGSSPSNKVFVVHGHNEAVREKVARFLEKLSLEPIILHEQPNKGRTIIEKFTDYSDVSYAVVLLTADDIGGTVGTPVKQLSTRARQNVIFELGYFIGRLGRDKVCALHESGVEILSDYQGVVYLPLDSHDAWRLSLAKELKSAGLTVDMNNAV